LSIRNRRGILLGQVVGRDQREAKAPSCGNKVLWEILLPNNQRVVSHSFKPLRDPLKQTRVVVLDVCDLSMYWFRSIGNLGAMSPSYALMSQAHAKNRDVICLKDLRADSKVLAAYNATSNM